MPNQHSKRHIEIFPCIQEYASRYAAGEGLYALASELKIAPVTLKKWICEIVPIRTTAEANTLHNKTRILPRQMPLEKRCSICKSIKPAINFRASKRSPTLLVPACRTCEAKQSREFQAKRKADPVVREHCKRLNRAHYLRVKFGMTLDEYYERIQAQGGVCAICKKTQKHRGLNVDHDHKTGKIRGILCDACNLGLGYFNDDPGLLVIASRYLIADAL